MTVVRTIVAIAVVGFSMAVSVSSQQEIDPNRLFVRVQTQLQPKPSPPTAGQLPILRPGTLVTATPDTPQSGAFVQVATDDGRKGFVLATAVRPLAVLEAECSSKRLGGSKASGRWTAPEVYPKLAPHNAAASLRAQ